MAAPVNVISVESVDKSFGDKALLDHVSLGVAVGQRIGVVGRNGGGKSTLLKVLGAQLEPDAGRVTTGRDVSVGLLHQAAPASELSIGEYLFADAADHEWSSDAATRNVLTGLLGGWEPEVLARQLDTLSGGQRRRVELAALLTSSADVLLLDEPTNHLDVEAVNWLADYLNADRRRAVVVVTHDRWFLDAVTDRTWEVVNGKVEEYDGGYSAFVLAKAERQRQADAAAARQANLLRKELAWLRRGAPARTSKPKFRIEAANALIDKEPPPRDSSRLQSFATARLGKTVIEATDLRLERDGNVVIDDLTWNIGPGDRVGLLGANGVGKSTLVAGLLGQLEPAAGRVKRGKTVASALLSQHLSEIDPDDRVLESVQAVAGQLELADGRSLSASQLCERLGFGPDAQWTYVGRLSGGERRRLQLTRLLMGGPNVLVLDEPTNDFDVETLTAMEDLLDGFPGTLIVISHDRYFLERVCDDFWMVDRRHHVVNLPGGVEQYVTDTNNASLIPHSTSAQSSARQHEPAPAPSQQALTSAQERQLRKEAARLESQIERWESQQTALHDQIAADPTNHELVAEVNASLVDLDRQISEAEDRWAQVVEALDG